MAVLTDLIRIIISDINDNQFIYLKEQDGERKLLIVIGKFEATIIHRRTKGHRQARPLTHELVVNSIEALGGEIQDIYIHDLRESTYYASLRVKHDAETIEIDCRPSDAIAAAMSHDPPLPIYVNESLLNLDI